jgi:hypothetical protein
VTDSGGKKPGIGVVSRTAMMASHNRANSAPQVTDRPGRLRWVFLRGTKALTCEIRVCGTQTYDVCVIPHWDVSSSAIERFNRPASALRRHAEIAWYFRQAGWRVVREATRSAAGVAA